MAEIQKVSQVTYQEIASYLRMAEVTPDDQNLLTTLIAVAKSFIAYYTGHTVEELDNYQDFVIVLYVLVQDMYDNRTLYVDNDNLNYVIQGILGMHSVNLLPTVSADD